MDDNTKNLVASSLVNAYYSCQEPRSGFLGEDRRTEETTPEGVRNFRSLSITPGEVFEVWQSFVKMLDKA